MIFQPWLLTVSCEQAAEALRVDSAALGRARAKVQYLLVGSCHGNFLRLAELARLELRGTQCSA